MQHEFRGRSLGEVVRKATGRGLRYKQQESQECIALKNTLSTLVDDVVSEQSEVQRLERHIERLSDQIQAEADAAPSQDIGRAILTIAATAATLIPAVRAVRIGIGAIRAARSVTQALRAGSTLGDAVSGVGAASLVGLDALKPSTKRQLQRALSDLDETKRSLNRTLSRINEVLTSLKDFGCEDIS